MDLSTLNTEDRIARTWDRCAEDSALKFGGGLLIGTLFSLLFFKRRSFPIILGAGFGLGMGCSNCERELNNCLQVNPCPPTLRKKDSD